MSEKQNNFNNREQDNYDNWERNNCDDRKCNDCDDQKRNDCNNRERDDCDNKKQNEKRCNPIASCLFSLPPKQFSLLGSLFGIILIDDLSVDEQNALGNFIVSVGQAILTAAAQAQLLESKNSQDDQILQEIDDLKKQICFLKKELDNQKH